MCKYLVILLFGAGYVGGRIFLKEYLKGLRQVHTLANPFVLIKFFFFPIQ
jgi:hypothetical protein